MEWRGLEDHLVPTSLPWQGHLPLDQVAQSHIQPDFDHLQGWDINNFSGQLMPVSHHSHSKEFLTNIYS